MTLRARSARVRREGTVGRYRNIETRIWNDEKFGQLDQRGKLAWLCLLTHPIMTPMGAGVVPPLLLDQVLDIDRGWCGDSNCEDSQGGCEHTGERYLERFKEASLVYRDNHLVIVRNYLVYNRPDNPNQLASWVSICEELPRSAAFSQLYEHLAASMGSEPTWLFTGLLKPLADGLNRSLGKEFWNRVGSGLKPSGQGIGKRLNERSKKPSKQPPQGSPVPVPDLSSSGSGSGSVNSGSALDWFEADFLPRYPANRQNNSLTTARNQVRDLNPQESLRETLITRLEGWKLHPDWMREGGRFVPGVGNFFKDGWYKRDAPHARASPNGTLTRAHADLQRQYEEAVREEAGSNQDTGSGQRELVSPANGSGDRAGVGGNPGGHNLSGRRPGGEDIH